VKTVATKIDSNTHKEIESRCGERGCTPSEYLRNLIKQDIEGQASTTTAGLSKARNVKVICDDTPSDIVSIRAVPHREVVQGKVRW